MATMYLDNGLKGCNCLWFLDAVHSEGLASAQSFIALSAACLYLDMVAAF